MYSSKFSDETSLYFLLRKDAMTNNERNELVLGVTAGEKVAARTGSWIEPRGRPRGLGGNGAAALSSGCVEIYYTLSKKSIDIIRGKTFNSS